MGCFFWKMCELMKMRNFPGHCEGHAKQKQQITASQAICPSITWLKPCAWTSVGQNVIQCSWPYVLFPSRCEPVLPSTSSILDPNVLIVSLDRHVVSVLAREVTNVTVLLPSGRSAELSVSKRSTVGDLKIAAQKAFQQGFLTLGV